MPLALFIFSFLIRLSLISVGPYHLDCLELAVRGRSLLESGQFNPLFGFGYPLALILSALFQGIARMFSFHDPVMAVNYMSVVFSSLSVLIFYFIGCRLFSRLAALCAALFLSVNPIFMGVSVYGISHPIALFFFLSSVLYLLRYQETAKIQNLYLSGVCFGLLGATRLQDMILLSLPVSFLYFAGTKIPEAAWESRKQNGWRRLRRFLLAALLAVGVALFLHLPIWLQVKSHDYTQQLALFFQVGLKENFRGIFSPSLWAVLKDFELSFSILGLLVALLGYLCLALERPRVFFFLFLWFLVPTLFYGNLFSSVSRFFVIVVPSLCLAMGFILARIIRLKTPYWQTGVIAFCVIIDLTFNYIYPILLFRHERSLLAEFAGWVASKTEPDARVIAIDINPFIEYYGHRQTLLRPASEFHLGDQSLLEFRRQLDMLLAQGVPVYITATGFLAYDPKKEFSQFFLKHYGLRVIGVRLAEEW